MTTTLKTLMRLKLQRTAAASAAVAARAPSPQANEHRMAKETGRNGYDVYTREEIKHSLFKFTARCRCTAGPMHYYGFCIVHKYVVLSAGTKEVPPSRSMFDISYTPPISRKFKYYIDSSRLFLLNALNNTAEG